MEHYLISVTDKINEKNAHSHCHSGYRHRETQRTPLIARVKKQLGIDDPCGGVRDDEMVFFLRDKIMPLKVIFFSTLRTQLASCCDKRLRKGGLAHVLPSEELLRVFGYLKRRGAGPALAESGADYEEGAKPPDAR